MILYYFLFCTTSDTKKHDTENTPESCRTQEGLDLESYQIDNPRLCNITKVYPLTFCENNSSSQDCSDNDLSVDRTFDQDLETYSSNKNLIDYNKNILDFQNYHGKDISVENFYILNEKDQISLDLNYINKNNDDLIDLDVNESYISTTEGSVIFKIETEKNFLDKDIKQEIVNDKFDVIEQDNVTNLLPCDFVMSNDNNNEGFFEDQISGVDILNNTNSLHLANKSTNESDCNFNITNESLLGTNDINNNQISDMKEKFTPHKLRKKRTIQNNPNFVRQKIFLHKHIKKRRNKKFKNFKHKIGRHRMALCTKKGQEDPLISQINTYECCVVRCVNKNNKKKYKPSKKCFLMTKHSIDKKDTDDQNFVYINLKPVVKCKYRDKDNSESQSHFLKNDNLLNSNVAYAEDRNIGQSHTLREVLQKYEKHDDVKSTIKELSPCNTLRQNEIEDRFVSRKKPPRLKFKAGVRPRCLML